MVNVLNKHNFIDNPKRPFNSDEYEMAGKFSNIDLDLPNASKIDKMLKRNTFNKFIKVNQPVKTKGTYLIHNVEYPVHLGNVIPLDDKAANKLRQQAAQSPNDFDCIIEPKTDVRFKGDIALQGHASNGHYIAKSHTRHSPVFYNQIKDIELDPNGPTKSLEEIDTDKPVQLRGKIEIYDRSQAHGNQKRLSYGTYPIKLGTITPQDYRAADSLADALDDHNLNLIVDKTSSVKFTGKHVPTGVVTDHSRVMLDEEARMDKVIVGDNSTINLNCGVLKNSILLGVDVQDLYQVGQSEITNSIIDAKVKHNHNKHTVIEVPTYDEDNFCIENSKIFGASSLSSSRIENSTLYSKPHKNATRNEEPEYDGMYDYSFIKNSVLTRTDAIASFIKDSKLYGSLDGIVLNRTHLDKFSLNNATAVMDHSALNDIFANADLTCENSTIRPELESQYDTLLINTPVNAKNLNVELGFQNEVEGVANVLSSRNGCLSCSKPDSTEGYQYDTEAILDTKLYQVPQTEMDAMLKTQDKFGRVDSKLIDQLDQHGEQVYADRFDELLDRYVDKKDKISKDNTSAKAKDDESWEL